MTNLKKWSGIALVAGSLVAGSLALGACNPIANFNDGDKMANQQDPLAAPSDVAAPGPDAEVTSTGLASLVLKPGTGTTHPTATDTVRVDYTGWTTDGKMFDSSVKRGQPISFPLNRVIAGWTEGLQLMVVGEKRRLWIPQDLAYKGQAGMPAGMLVFDVELYGINE